MDRTLKIGNYQLWKAVLEVTKIAVYWFPHISDNLTGPWLYLWMISGA